MMFFANLKMVPHEQKEGYLIPTLELARFSENEVGPVMKSKSIHIEIKINLSEIYINPQKITKKI